MLVGASEFTSGITSQLTKLNEEAEAGKATIALFAEREVPKVKYEVQPIFPEFETGRAVGDGIQPVLVDLDKQDVGSEGIVAALISKFCKSNSSTSLSHPGPDKLRANRVRKIVIVTDFIGSGRRISEMLDAFSKVATLQSWQSYRLLTYHVVCYSATDLGLQSLARHPLRPSVSVHIACPVIDEAFEGTELGEVKQLCLKYPKMKSRFPFGFNNTGSLIAFSHGIPNNAPQILHSSRAGWKPLFKGRSTLASNLDAIADSSELLQQNSQRVLRVRDAKQLLTDSEGELWAHAMLTLDAVNKGLRTPTKLSARTQIPMLRVQEILKIASEAGWLTPNLSLTRLGRREIRWFRMFRSSADDLAYPENELYFPSQLRAP
tara:strand:+ start:7275 stop:8405 length:1131 start_codon:yes stop_codon:yes gene_type:complete